MYLGSSVVFLSLTFLICPVGIMRMPSPQVRGRVSDTLHVKHKAGAQLTAVSCFGSCHCCDGDKETCVKSSTLSRRPGGRGGVGGTQQPSVEMRNLGEIQVWGEESQFHLECVEFEVWLSWSLSRRHLAGQGWSLGAQILLRS